MEKLKNNFKYYFILSLFAVVVFVWYAVFVESRSGLEVSFLDVGQGDAVFIQAENGNLVLIDGGENKTVLSQLTKVMPFYDRSIDVLMLSHSHGDHIGGLIEVLKRYKVSLVVESCWEAEPAEYKEWQQLIKDKKITRVCVSRGQKINISEDLYFDVLLPVGEVAGRKIHDAMFVAKLNYGKTSFLFTGDMEKNQEKYLVDVNKEILKSSVLKVGHHGSDTSSSEMFLGYINPQYAVISCGRDNKFGHPHSETLEKLERFEIPVLRTDEAGIIKIKTDGEQVTIGL